MLIFHSYIFFSKIPIQIFGSFLKIRLFGLLLLNFEDSFYILGTNHLSYVLCKCFLPISGLSINLLNGVFSKTDYFLFFNFKLSFIVLWSQSKNPLLPLFCQLVVSGKKVNLLCIPSWSEWEILNHSLLRVEDRSFIIQSLTVWSKLSCIW